MWRDLINQTFTAQYYGLGISRKISQLCHIYFIYTYFHLK